VTVSAAAVAVAADVSLAARLKLDKSPASVCALSAAASL
jgi:hypothetical protein